MPQKDIGLPESVLISIIDDDKTVRESLQALVRSLGYATAAFSSAAEFMLSGLHRTTCLLSDVQMPGVGGLELQAQLIEKGLHIPIIFITGHSNETLKARALQAGAVDFLNKPVDPNRLVECLLKAITMVTTKSPGEQSVPGLRSASA
jgi:FixJ family two-component response regulator